MHRLSLVKVGICYIYLVIRLLDCFFFLQNNPENLDLSYKTDLVFLGLFWRRKTHLIAGFHKSGLDEGAA